MSTSRRKFLKLSALSLIISPILKAADLHPAIPTFQDTLKPPALQKGDKIAIIAPGGAIFNRDYILKFHATLKEIGLEPVTGASCFKQYGQFAGTDKERAEEFMRFIRNPEIKGLIAMRGGSGCARILDLLDYKTIQQNPKVIIGFSDLTSLLNGIYSKTGLITFHGPVGYSSWNDFTTRHFKSIFLKNETGDFPTHTDTTLKALSPGTVTGPLIGGNLSVFASLLGTPYMPDPEGAILFLEEIDEEPYTIDRMLTQLKLAGVLDKIGGILLGNFKRCVPEEPERSLSLQATFDLNLSGLKIPVMQGGNFGHTTHKWTLPIGIRSELDANNKKFILREQALR